MADSGTEAADLLAQVRRGNDDAARALVERLYPLVMKIVRAHLPRRVAEEDLAQDIFLKMFTHLDQFRGGVPFEHWVSRIAVTTCLDQLRAQRRRPELRWADLGETEAEVLAAVMTRGEEAHPAQSLAAREIVARLLEQLSPADRLVVTLLDLEERSLAEIRVLTGWNETLIKVRAFRARRKMKKLLNDLEKGRLE